MRTVQRSMRLDEDLEKELKKLPRGTTNDLMNQLLRLYLNNKIVQDMVTLKDSRHVGPVQKPVQSVDKVKALAGNPQLPTKPESVLDEIVPG